MWNKVLTFVIVSLSTCTGVHVVHVLCSFKLYFPLLCYINIYLLSSPTRLILIVKSYFGVFFIILLLVVEHKRRDLVNVTSFENSMSPLRYRKTCDIFVLLFSKYTYVDYTCASFYLKMNER